MHHATHKNTARYFVYCSHRASILLFATPQAFLWPFSGKTVQRPFPEVASLPSGLPGAISGTETIFGSALARVRRHFAPPIAPDCSQRASTIFFLTPPAFWRRFFSIAHSFSKTLGFKANANDHFCYAFLRRCDQKLRFVRGGGHFTVDLFHRTSSCDRQNMLRNATFPQIVLSSLLQKLSSGVLGRLL